MRKIVFIQPNIANYRLDFYERLYERFGKSFSVHFSTGVLGNLTPELDRPWAIPIGATRDLGLGLFWQNGALSVDVGEGDIVVLCGNPRFLSTLVNLFRFRFAGAHVIWWGHYRSSTTKAWRHFIRHFPMSVPNALLFYTDEEVVRYKSLPFGRIDRRPVAALNNSINIDPISKFKTSYKASERDNAILFIGRLTAKSNLPLLLKAVSLLGKSGPDLHVIGDGERSAELIVEAEKLGLDRVRWHGSLTKESEIAKIANSCRAFAYPGEVGLSLIHAMAYGLPSIVHDTPRFHMPEIAAFLPEKTGRSFEHNSTKDLADVIKYLMWDFITLDSFSKSAVSLIQSRFSTEMMAENFIHLVTNLSFGPLANSKAGSSE